MKRVTRIQFAVVEPGIGASVYGWGMGVSETIIAASIGAGATVITALFQLFGGLRATNSKADSRPKRDRTIRSFISVVMLMIASAASGYLFSEFRNARAADDMRSMREEINAKLQALAQSTERLATARQNAVESSLRDVPAVSPQVKTVTDTRPGSIESTLYVPGCSTACAEATAQHLSLCGTIPEDAQISKVDLYLADAGPPAVGALFKQNFARVEFEQDIDGAKFTGEPIESTRDENGKTMCVDFAHWGERPHIARMVLRLDTAPQAQAGIPLRASPPITTNAATPTAAAMQNAALVGQ